LGDAVRVVTAEFRRIWRMAVEDLPAFQKKRLEMVAETSLEVGFRKVVRLGNFEKLEDE
jgi:hypothetical protein